MEYRALKFSRFNFVENIHCLKTAQTEQQSFKVVCCIQIVPVQSHWGMRNKSLSKFIFEYVKFVQIFNKSQAQLRLAQAQVRSCAWRSWAPGPDLALFELSHKAVLASSCLHIPKDKRNLLCDQQKLEFLS